MKIDRPTFVFFILCGAVYVTIGQSAGVLRKDVTLTDVQLKQLQEAWKIYGPDYSAYQKTDIDYPCGPMSKSSPAPTSVHRLRPGDIKVVGAMGDSLTAGTGLAAFTILGDLIQYRGLTWSGGGQSNYEDQITVPNILKKYNSEVYGYATGNGDEDSSRSYLNVAVSGSTSSDLVAQARKLIDRMKADPRVDVANDWKVVTVLSGNNDLCDYCRKKDIYNVDNFRKHLLAALDMLHAELPRTLVNLVEPLNVEILSDLNKGIICSIAHLYACDCAAFPGSAEAERELIFEADMYQVTVEEIARSGRYDSREDFTVVHQPFFNGTYLPRLTSGEPDLSYFAPDCFHLSRRGQAAAASALWTNMVEPVGQKKTAWTPGEAIECPTEAHPYFFTNKNSDINYLQSDSGVHKTSHTPTPLSEEEGGLHHSLVIPFAICAVIALAGLIVLVVVIKRRWRRYSYTRV